MQRNVQQKNKMLFSFLFCTTESSELRENMFKIITLESFVTISKLSLRISPNSPKSQQNVRWNKGTLSQTLHYEILQSKTDPDFSQFLYFLFINTTSIPLYSLKCVLTGTFYHCHLANVHDLHSKYGTTTETTKTHNFTLRVIITSKIHIEQHFTNIYKSFQYLDKLIKVNFSN